MNILMQFLHIRVMSRTLAIFALGCLILLTIQLYTALHDIVNGKLSLDLLWQIVSLFIIHQSGFLLNICYLLALLFLLAGLYSNNEIYIIKNLGIGDGKLFAWLLIPSGVVCLSVGVAVFYLAPVSMGQIDRIYSTNAIYSIESLGDGARESSEDTSLRLIDNLLEIWHIKDGRSFYSYGKFDGNNRPAWEDGSVKVPLTDGKVLSWEEENSFSETSFSSLEFYLNIDTPRSYEFKSVPTLQLIESELEGFNLGNSEELRLRVELYERLAIFIASLFILPWALVATRQQTRKSTGMNVFRGMLGFIFYMILQVIGIDIIRNGGSASYFWSITILLYSIIFILIAAPGLTRKAQVAGEKG